MFKFKPKLTTILIVLLTLYAPAELTRVIVICTWGNTVIDHSITPHYYFILELAFFWLSQVVGWALVYKAMKVK